MMDVLTSHLARELTADRLRAAERARVNRIPPVSVLGPAASRRQLSRVVQSLLLVPNRRESAAKEAE